MIQRIELTADNIVQRSELTRSSINDYQKKLISDDHAPPLEFCKYCSSGTAHDGIIFDKLPLTGR